MCASCDTVSCDGGDASAMDVESLADSPRDEQIAVSLAELAPSAHEGAASSCQTVAVLGVLERPAVSAQTTSQECLHIQCGPQPGTSLVPRSLLCILGMETRVFSAPNAALAFAMLRGVKDYQSNKDAWRPGWYHVLVPRE